MMPEMTLTLTPCNVAGVESCPYAVVMQSQGINVWCAKWRLQRDRETMIRGCNPDYPQHFKE
jgi:hypothetical protein